jgi:hypothetical protein
MPDNRIQIKIRGVRANEYCLTTGGNQARLEEDVVQFRNDLRAAFVGPRFVTSDIARWVPGAGQLGYAFLFRDTTLGCEWMFGYGGRSDSSNQGWLTQFWGNGSVATLGTYFKTDTGNAIVNPSFPNGGLGIHFFNHSYASSSFGFGFINAGLQLSAGDFTAPAVSPFSNLAGFMPATAGRCPGFDLSNWGANESWSRRCLTYDTTKGVMSIDITSGQNIGAIVTVISGLRMFPTNASGGLAGVADVRQDGLLIIKRNPSGQAWSTLESGQAMFVFFIRENGTTVETNGRPANILNNFNRANYLSGGQVQVRKLEIGVIGYIKGFLDWEIVNESFPHNDGGFNMMPLALPDLDNPMLHDHPQLTRMWKKDAAPFIVVPESGLPIT